MFTENRWTEIDLLEREIIRLEDEYNRIEDERSALNMGDENYDGKIKWYDEELNSLFLEIEDAREELRCLMQG